LLEKRHFKGSLGGKILFLTKEGKKKPPCSQIGKRERCENAFEKGSSLSRLRRRRKRAKPDIEWEGSKSSIIQRGVSGFQLPRGEKGPRTDDRKNDHSRGKKKAGGNEKAGQVGKKTFCGIGCGRKAGRAQKGKPVKGFPG